MTTLLLVEHDNSNLSEQTAKALTAAKALGGDVHALVAGSGCGAVAEAAAGLDGVAKVLVADDAAYGHQLAEPLAALMVSLAGGYDAIAAAATTTGKNVLPRVAALIDVTWKYINEPYAFAFNELLVHNRARHNAQIAEQQERISGHDMKQVWEKYFREFGIPAARLETARNLTLAALQGLSMMRLVSRRRPAFDNEIAALKRVVVQLLTG